MKALLVMSSLEKPGASMMVATNREKARPVEFKILQDLESCLESQTNKENINE